MTLNDSIMVQNRTFVDEELDEFNLEEFGDLLSAIDDEILTEWVLQTVQRAGQGPSAAMARWMEQSIPFLFQ